MPELPEVESIRRQLEKFIVGHTIQEVEANYKNFEGNVANLEGAKIKKIRRFGKVLVVDLGNNYSLVIHIKLTGQLIYRGPKLKKEGISKKIFGGIPSKHTHVTFDLDKGAKLYYNDYRKFGWLKVVKTDEVKNIGFIKKLGPEPPVVQGFARQAPLTLDKFKRLTTSTKKAIKTLIMDQSKMGGVGNIYANDALWLAKIHPGKPANTLSSNDARRLYEAIKEVLKRGLKYGGASEIAFVTPDGNEGGYQNHALVYGKDGKCCKRHPKIKIKKIRVGGRGTYFCPACQRLKS